MKKIYIALIILFVLITVITVGINKINKKETYLYESEMGDNFKISYKVKNTMPDRSYEMDIYYNSKIIISKLKTQIHYLDIISFLAGTDEGNIYEIGNYLTCVKEGNIKLITPIDEVKNLSEEDLKLIGEGLILIYNDDIINFEDLIEGLLILEYQEAEDKVTQYSNEVFDEKNKHWFYSDESRTEFVNEMKRLKDKYGF